MKNVRLPDGRLQMVCVCNNPDLNLFREPIRGKHMKTAATVRIVARCRCGHHQVLRYGGIRKP